MARLTIFDDHPLQRSKKKDDRYGNNDNVGKKKRTRRITSQVVIQAETEKRSRKQN
jgi:hypothetical protein